MLVERSTTLSVQNEKAGYCTRSLVEHECLSPHGAYGHSASRGRLGRKSGTNVMSVGKIAMSVTSARRIFSRSLSQRSLIFKASNTF
jgi:hypothetical protein